MIIRHQSLLLLALLFAATPVRGYEVGVNSSYSPNVSEATLRGWAVGSGARMPRIGVRRDLLGPYPDHADRWVNDFLRVGGTPLLFLMNEDAEHRRADGTAETGMKPPEGLREPVFADGTDTGRPGAPLNPKNEWALFVARVVERFDADGKDDAPGSPKVTWFTVWNEPDWLPWPERPSVANQKMWRNWWGRDTGDLARLALVSYRAAKSANPRAKVGMQLCFPETLAMLLDDRKHPLDRNCDFVDYHSYAGPSSDSNVYHGDGLLPMLRRMKAEYLQRKLAPPQFLCTESGVTGGLPGSPSGRTQAAAVLKVNVAAAAAGLVTVCWYGLNDPSWQEMGLIGDLTGLPSDGKGAVMKDAWTAMGTVGLLLRTGTRFVRELPLGEKAHGYAFRDAAGRDLVFAWADDGLGPDPKTPATDASVTVRLPMASGRWETLPWDYTRGKRPGKTLTVGADGAELTLTPMPTILRRTPVVHRAGKPKGTTK